MAESKTTQHDVCAPVPEFERLNFYYGQSLGVADFRSEQQYFLEKLRLHNRCLHGYGVVCGLEIEPVPTHEDCISQDDSKRAGLRASMREIEKKIAQHKQALEKGSEDAEQIKEELEKLYAEREALQRELDGLPPCKPVDESIPAQVLLNCGFALDCHGRELIVRTPVLVDIWSLLSPTQRRQIRESTDDQQDSSPVVELDLSICYCEQPTYPSRPVITNTCDAIANCVYGRTREGYRLQVSLTPATPDKRCDPCCEPCESECVLLARIRWNPHAPITSDDIDLGVRRMLALYETTRITGISWKHGATYAPAQAKAVLGTVREQGPRSDGLEVVFSKPVYAETLQPGVVDLWRVQGGGGLRGVISHVEGSYVDKPGTGLISAFKYRDDSGETLNSGDRILITIRAGFILDECCKPVDGIHVGGLVPQLPAYQQDKEQEEESESVPPCAKRPAYKVPWTSGNGVPGSTFESWIFVS